tara:strand:- start:88 stop:375 length:288 start_codon:yes stop_codon:yes gene_type:complete
MAATPIPRGTNVSKIELSGSRIRGFLIIVEVIASSLITHSSWEIDSKAPPGKVESMDSIVDQFSSSVRPVPMPIVVDEVVFVGFPRNGSLPELVV